MVTSAAPVGCIVDVGPQLPIVLCGVCCRGFPVEQFRGDRLGQVLAFWSFALHLGRPLVSLLLNNQSTG